MRTPTLPLLATGLILTACRHEPLPVCEAEPAHFCEIFLDLNQTLSTAQRVELRAMPPSETGNLHFDLGMHVRNTYGLWEDNRTTAYFRSIGIEHPDNMSGPIMAGYIHYLRGNSVDMLTVSQVQEPYLTDAKLLPMPATQSSAAGQEAADDSIL